MLRPAPQKDYTPTKGAGGPSSGPFPAISEINLEALGCVVMAFSMTWRCALAPQLDDVKRGFSIEAGCQAKV